VPRLSGEREGGRERERERERGRERDIFQTGSVMVPPAQRPRCAARSLATAGVVRRGGGERERERESTGNHNLHCAAPARPSVEDGDPTHEDPAGARSAPERTRTSNRGPADLLFITGHAGPVERRTPPPAGADDPAAQRALHRHRGRQGGLSSQRHQAPPLSPKAPRYGAVLLFLVGARLYAATSEWPFIPPVYVSKELSCWVE
jgi:hypothetical protein